MILVYTTIVDTVILCGILVSESWNYVCNTPTFRDVIYIHMKKQKWQMPVFPGPVASGA